ncbi:hypothetical protein FACS189429_7640 [Bacteroidia bacterium]|nr:hypothetical protein FACS189429_7640 [Bacteroidia bacterium]
MKRKVFLTAGVIALMSGAALNAQVGINTETPKASLDIVASQTDGTTAEGIIVPRLTLAQLNAKRAQYGIDQTGAQVYITDYSGVTVPSYSDQITCVGFAYWNGAHWIGDCAVAKTYTAITTQPQPFTFYENPADATAAGGAAIQPLVLGAGGSSTVSYQWYIITGNNVHVRIARKCTAADGTGFNAASFTPTSVKKGDTKNAANTGFYRYFCVAKNQTNDSVISSIAEVAVGCGAKDLNGEWVSFMCYNLGATSRTIAAQKATTLTHPDYNSSTGVYTYVAGDTDLYGDLYQWGRIGDGHHYRNSAQVTYSATTLPTIASGNLVGATQRYPTNQVATTDATYYGKFIVAISANASNWYRDISVATNATNSDALWRSSRYAANDPCTKVTADGNTPAAPYALYYPATDGAVATYDGQTGWRLPVQDEWGNIYRGSMLAGSPANALANTWKWYYNGANNVQNGSKGYEIQPDGATTTLFLPASGYRAATSGNLTNAGNYGYYWSATISGSNSLALYFASSSVQPAYSSSRAGGFALRCVKN